MITFSVSFNEVIVIFIEITPNKILEITYGKTESAEQSEGQRAIGIVWDQRGEDLEDIMSPGIQFIEYLPVVALLRKLGAWAVVEKDEGITV